MKGICGDIRSRGGDAQCAMADLITGTFAPADGEGWTEFDPRQGSLIYRFKRKRADISEANP